MAALSFLLATVAGFASVSAQESACDGACAGTYDKCIGRDIFSLKACCDPDDECVKFNKYFGQCRPKSNPRFDDDWLGVAVDCTECGVETRQIGEFNFASSIYCEIEFLGSLTLSECASTCGNSGNYVACDRPADTAPNTPASCYGYFELFEGGCFMRNPDDTFWTSWLTCPPTLTANTASAVADFGTTDEPASEDAESLAADIAADEEASSGRTMAQREKDMAGK